jgi:MoaA/NifB/PqqE/SkfB family radical SAM enzyme
MAAILEKNKTERSPANNKGYNSGKSNNSYSVLLDGSLRIFFWNAFKICASNPAQAYSFFRTVQQQIKAAGVRSSYEKQGIHVPPMMIYSVTSRCNLHCKGCYHHSLRTGLHEELSTEKMESVIKEAGELGISFIILAGGEPLVRRELIDICGSYPNIQFLIFTNGMLIDDDLVARLDKQRNIIPVISLEGNQAETDNRRGPGIYTGLETTIAKLKKKHIFWGTSPTVTRANYATLTGEQFVLNLFNKGCRLFFFSEYTPVVPGTEGWVITDEQRARLVKTTAEFRQKFAALFVSVPGDESEFGGCLAAGRGFIHVSSEGNVEPCPFVPYSDTNLKNVSLKEALQSKFLACIRDNADCLDEGPGGCALWDKKEWLEEQLAGK